MTTLDTADTHHRRRCYLPVDDHPIYLRAVAMILAILCRRPFLFWSCWTVLLLLGHAIKEQEGRHDSFSSSSSLQQKEFLSSSSSDILNKSLGMWNGESRTDILLRFVLISSMFTLFLVWSVIGVCRLNNNCSWLVFVLGKCLKIIPCDTVHW